MQPHQQRVVDEKAALDLKREALRTFIASHPTFETLPVDEQNRLRRQHVAMVEYSDVLGERVAAFAN